MNGTRSRSLRLVFGAFIGVLVLGLGALPARALDAPAEQSFEVVISLDAAADVNTAASGLLSAITDVESVDVLETLGIVTATVTIAELEAIRNDPAIRSIEEDTLLSPALDESVPLIGATSAHAAGETGSGTAIAIVDTGVDVSHRFIRGAVVHEACFTRDSCPGGRASATGPGSAAPCAATGCSHGTHVAGIVAGRDGSRVGVAPDTDLIAIQVFSMINDRVECGSAAATPCARARTSDVLAALDYLYRIRNQFDLVAVNLSLSGDEALSSCDGLAMKSGIDRLRQANVISIAASGNGRSSRGLGIPACISSTVSVGATHTDDTKWMLSNRSNKLDFWAPGVDIGSSTPGGGYTTASGTSAAAPHVTAAWALATKRLGTTDVDTVLDYLKGSAVALPGEEQQRGIARRIDLRSLVSGAASATRPNQMARAGDFNGDGRGDLLWYGPGNAKDELWFGRSDRSFDRKQLTVASDFDPFVGDFDGDGRDDIFWNGAGRADWIWFGKSNRGFDGVRTGVSDNFSPAVGDFDGDGRDDIFWNSAGRGDWIWFGNSNRTFTGKRSAASDGYTPTTGDFDGDGRDDILWYHPTGVDWVWFGKSNRGFDGARTNLGSGYTAIPGDFDGDGRDDIFWNSAGSADWIWFGKTDRTFAPKRAAATGDYQTASGDFDGDGRDDIFWDGAGSADFIWFGTSEKSFRPGSVSLR